MSNQWAKLKKNWTFLFSLHLVVLITAFQLLVFARISWRYVRGVYFFAICMQSCTLQKLFSAGNLSPGDHVCGSYRKVPFQCVRSSVNLSTGIFLNWGHCQCLTSQIGHLMVNSGGWAGGFRLLSICEIVRWTIDI